MEQSTSGNQKIRAAIPLRVNSDMGTDSTPLHVIGVIRDRNLDKSAALTVLFSGPIGDTDLREFHEYVSKWRVGKRDRYGYDPGGW